MVYGLLRQRIWKKLALLIAGTAVGFAAAELAVRALVPVREVGQSKQPQRVSRALRTPFPEVALRAPS